MVSSLVAVSGCSILVGQQVADAANENSGGSSAIGKPVHIGVAQPGLKAGGKPTTVKVTTKNSSAAIDADRHKDSWSDQKDFGPITNPELDKVHALFSTELSKYVSDGTVNYREWQKNQKGLSSYLQRLSSISTADYEKLSRREKLALWINAYNAFTIQVVMKNYPIKGTKTYYPVDSIRQVDGFWENNFTTIAGRKISLESMEHDILRRDFFDARTHFVVVCAARGCAKLNNTAYTARALDAELNKAMTDFLSDEHNVRFDVPTKTVHVSALFKWFPLDFAPEVGLEKRFPPPTDDEIVLRYLLAKSPLAVRSSIKDLTDFKVVYDNYDWSLNDVH